MTSVLLKYMLTRRPGITANQVGKLAQARKGFLGKCSQIWQHLSRMSTMLYHFETDSKGIAPEMKSLRWPADQSFHEVAPPRFHKFDPLGSHSRPVCEDLHDSKTVIDKVGCWHFECTLFRMQIILLVTPSTRSLPTIRPYLPAVKISHGSEVFLSLRQETRRLRMVKEMKESRGKTVRQIKVWRHLYSLERCQCSYRSWSYCFGGN